jgi:peptidoglycan/LPS O-acetylase OafA/YrhL
MPPTGTDTPPEPAPPLARHAQLEVDAFCIRCNYNLHGQDVWLDDRLNFPICRCPECGQHFPAGTGVTAQSVWLRRFAALLLAAWIVIVLIATFLACLSFGGIQASYVGTFTYWVQNPTNAPHFNPEHTLQPPPQYDVQSISDNRTAVGISTISIAVGFLVGTLIVSFLWHWPRRRYALTLLLPFISATLVILSYYNDPSYDDIFPWCRDRILLQALCQFTGMIIGILLGRKLARTIVRSIVPPKPRQLLIFLWRADGKTPPPP